MSNLAGQSRLHCKYLFATIGTKMGTLPLPLGSHPAGSTIESTGVRFPSVLPTHSVVVLLVLQGPL